MGAVTKDTARSMGADRASEDKAPDPPSDWSDENRLAYLEGFTGAAEQWAEDLRDRAALADELAEEIRGETGQWPKTRDQLVEENRKLRDRLAAKQNALDFLSRSEQRAIDDVTPLKREAEKLRKELADAQRDNSDLIDIVAEIDKIMAERREG